MAAETFDQMLLRVRAQMRAGLGPHISLVERDGEWLYFILLKWVEPVRISGVLILSDFIYHAANDDG